LKRNINNLHAEKGFFLEKLEKNIILNASFARKCTVSFVTTVTKDTVVTLHTEK